MRLSGLDLPIIQAPMAGVQLGALAAAVSGAGGLGSLPCAMLTPEAMKKELELIRACTSAPYNVNFFCHVAPKPDGEREAAWRRTLGPAIAASSWATTSRRRSARSRSCPRSSTP